MGYSGNKMKRRGPFKTHRSHIKGKSGTRPFGTFAKRITKQEIKEWEKRVENAKKEKKVHKGGNV
jgi:hypothetical protein